MPLENLSPNNTHLSTSMVSPAAITEIKKWTIDEKEINVVNKNNKAQFMVTQYGRNTLIPAHDITGIPNGLNLTMLTAFLANTWVRLQPVGQGEYTLHINQRLQGGGNIIRNPHKLWPNGIIPYQIDEKIYRDDGIYSFEAKEKQIILGVIAEWNHADTGFQIVPHTNQANVLIFGEDPKACYSQVGCQGGEQYIRCRLETGAFNRAKILQEIAHAVGLYPEHNRFDRDHYISVPGSGDVEAYKKLPEINAVGPYDFASITHCAIKASDDDPEKVAINFASLGDWTKFIGRAERLSLGDIAAAKQLYQTALSIHVPSSNAVLSHVVDNREGKSAVVVLNKDTSFINFSHLQDLKIRSNGAQFTSLPVGLGQLSNLQRLAIEVEYLIFLPVELGQLNNLQSLEMCAPQLTSLPAELGQLNNLQSLEMYTPQLTSLAELRQLSNLQNLKVYTNQLTSLPEELGQLNNLQSLEIKANCLTSLPASLGQLSNLQALKIYSSLLTCLPGELGKLSNLQSLDIRGNKLTSPSVELQQLTKLQSLVIEANHLASSAKLAQLKELPGLKSITIYNYTTSLTELGQLDNLQSLEILSQQSTFPPTGLGHLSNLQSLVIHAYQSISLPAELGQLNNLQSLTINAGQLTSLPVELRQLSNLKSLAINAHQLTSLSNELGQLSNLQNLTINANQLTSLPGELGQLSHLQSLTINANQLTSLPGELGQLSHLQSLTINANQLTSLPDELGQLSHLQSLTINGEQLTSLPNKLRQLSHLQSLTINANQLTSLPSELGQLSNLQRSEINGYHFTSPTQLNQYLTIFNYSRKK